MADNPPETASSSSQPPPLPSSSKSPQDSVKQSQVPTFPGGYYQMFPAPVPGLAPSQNHEPVNRGAGIYAVPVYPYNNAHVTGLPYNTLIPLTYTTPTINSRSSSEAATVSENQGQAAQQQQPQQQQPAPQRQVVVRRFQVAFQIDLFLMLKLAAVIFLFNHDGSRQRLVVLVLLASLVYLYQTGALTPIIRWLSQGMQRAVAPPDPPRPAARAENVPAARPEVNNAASAEGQPEAGIRDQPTNDADQAVENENVAEPGGGNGGNRWWAIVKEIKMIVLGFITSLLPGFHNHMD